MPHCSRDDVVGHSIKAHPLWVAGSITIHFLRHNMRAREDGDWREYLLDVGDGNIETLASVGEFSIRIRDDILAPRGWTSMDLVRHIFPELLAAAHQSVQPACPPELRAFWGERAILTATNAMVDEVNNAILHEFPEDVRMTYLSVDEVDASTPQEKALWPLDFLHSLTPAGIFGPLLMQASCSKKDFSRKPRNPSGAHVALSFKVSAAALLVPSSGKPCVAERSYFSDSF